MGGDVTQKALKNFNPLFALNYSATHAKHHNLVYVLDALDAFNKRLVKKIEVKGFEVKNFRRTDSYLYLEQIVLSSKNRRWQKSSWKLPYNKSINRETRILGVGDDPTMFRRKWSSTRAIRFLKLTSLRSTVTFTNGEGYQSLGDVVGDVSEKDMRRIQIRETILSHFEKKRFLNIVSDHYSYRKVELWKRAKPLLFDLAEAFGYTVIFSNFERVIGYTIL